MKKNPKILYALAAFCFLAGSFSKPIQAAADYNYDIETEEINATDSDAMDSTYGADSAAPAALDEDPLACILDDRAENSKTFFNGPQQSLKFFSSYNNPNYIHNPKFNGMQVRNGIDVSYYQKDIDWNAVKNSGVEFVIIRCGYRGYASGTIHSDPKFDSYIQGALAAKLKVGVYFFSQAITPAEAVEEASFMMNKIGSYNLTLPVVMDYEYAGENDGGRLYSAGLSPSAATAVCSAFCDTVSSAGYTPMIYANKTMLENHIDGNGLGQKYKIWLAHYTTQTSYAGNYSFWQYTSSGSVNGISGEVDMNFWYDANDMPLVGTTDARTFVSRLYKNLLGREPDSVGLSSYTRALTNGELTASSLALALMESSEFKNKNYSNEDFISRLYNGLLSRGPSSAELSNWSVQLNNGMSQRYILAQISGSSEFSGICRKLNMAQGKVPLSEPRDLNYNLTSYVMRCYEKLLGRKADTTGLNTWTERLLSGAGGSEIMWSIVNSNEFKNNNYSPETMVEIFYQAMLGRSADATGKQNWVNCLNQGVSANYVLKGLTDSPEFSSLCAKYGMHSGSFSFTESRDKNLAVTSFVNRCYRTALNRNPDPDGLNNWCAQLLSRSITPREVAFGFAFSAEAQTYYAANESFVEMLYRLCLGRSSDPTGKNNWVGRLNNGDARVYIFQGFADSTEFNNIVRSYGL